VDFSGATLASADLRNADLRGINCTHIVKLKARISLELEMLRKDLSRGH
jgi:uncharacterized protein YjbI with pentapeptide repeats